MLLYDALLKLSLLLLNRIPGRAKIFIFIVYGPVKYSFIMWFKIQLYNLAVSYLFNEMVSISLEFV